MIAFVFDVGVGEIGELDDSWEEDQIILLRVERGVASSRFCLISSRKRSL